MAKLRFCRCMYAEAQKNEVTATLGANGVMTAETKRVLMRQNLPQFSPFPMCYPCESWGKYTGIGNEDLCVALKEHPAKEKTVFGLTLGEVGKIKEEIMANEADCENF